MMRALLPMMLAVALAGMPVMQALAASAHVGGDNGAAGTGHVHAGSDASCDSDFEERGSSQAPVMCCMALAAVCGGADSTFENLSHFLPAGNAFALSSTPIGPRSGRYVLPELPPPRS